MREIGIKRSKLIFCIFSPTFFLVSSWRTAFLRISMSFMEKLLDEKARAKLVIVDGRTVKLERYISSADPLATLSYRE